MLLSKVPEKNCDSFSTIWLNCRNETLNEHSSGEKTPSQPISSVVPHPNLEMHCTAGGQGLSQISEWNFSNGSVHSSEDYEGLWSFLTFGAAAHKRSRVVLNLGLYERLRWLCRNQTTWTSCTNTPARDGQNKKMLKKGKKEERFLIWIGPAKASVPTRAA